MIKQAAAEPGVSPATWDDRKKGRRFPSMDDLNLLSQYLRLPHCIGETPVATLVSVTAPEQKV